jgi:hypothetical protein
MSKQEKLLKFYLSLQDAAKLKRYQDDLEGLMTEEGLSDDDKELVRRGDEKEVHAAIGDRHAAAFRFIAPPRYGHLKKP